MWFKSRRNVLFGWECWKLLGSSLIEFEKIIPPIGTSFLDLLRNVDVFEPNPCTRAQSHTLTEFYYNEGVYRIVIKL